MKKNVIPLVIIAMVVAILSTGVFYGLVVSRMDASASSLPTPAPPLEQKPSGKEIPLGMRAITVHVADSGGVIKLLKAGDRVDVHQVVHRHRNGEQIVEAKTILENALVYEIPDLSNPNMQGRAMLTILASPGEAETLAAADAGSRIRVVLRNPKDDSVKPAPAPAPKVSSRFVPQAPLEPVELELKVFRHSGEDSSSLGVERADWSFDSKDYQLVESVRIQAGKSGELGWRGQDGSVLRVKVEPLSPQAGETRLRVIPEAADKQTTRRVESIVSLSRKQGALIRGLEPEALVWVAPVGKP